MINTESLQKNRAFRAVYGSGQSAANRLLVMYIRHNAGHINRLGVSVSKKVGKAVTRNRVKRLIRESWRLTEKRIQTGYDVVLVARASAGALSRPDAFREIGRSLLHLLKKHNLLLAEPGPEAYMP